MPCDPRFAGKQINRFQVLSGWKDLEKSGRVELATQLAGAAKNEYHATRIVERWLAAERWLPTPADLHRLALETPLNPEPMGSGGCDRCNRSGRVSGWYLWSVERYPSGDLRRHISEFVPPNPIWAPHGLEFWAMYEPTLPLGKDQCVRSCSDFCDCALGLRLRAGELRQRHEAALAGVA